MPSKKKGPGEQKSKKAIAEAKRIRAQDQTFGIKNKSKGAAPRRRRAPSTRAAGTSRFVEKMSKSVAARPRSRAA